MTFLNAVISKAGGRSYNQDSHGMQQHNGTFCCVVADGLGGHHGGGIASMLAVDSIIQSFHADTDLSPMALGKHFEKAQAEIIRHQRENEELSALRTTAVILIANHHSAIWGHIGDTRLYHVRDNRIRSRTKDHSVPQALVNAGDISIAEIRHHPDRNRLLQSLGSERIKPMVLSAPEPLQKGDAFLLCTDGFWEYVYDLEIETSFTQAHSPKEWLEKMELMLLRKADGEHDNYTGYGIWMNRKSLID